MIRMLTHVIARRSHGLTKQNLAHINSDIFVSIDGFCYLCRTGREFKIPFCTITMELDMG